MKSRLGTLTAFLLLWLGLFLLVCMRWKELSETGGTNSRTNALLASFVAKAPASSGGDSWSEVPRKKNPHEGTVALEPPAASVLGNRMFFEEHLTRQGTQQKFLPSCSCWNAAYASCENNNNRTEVCVKDNGVKDNGAKKCCKRTLLVAHKMGFHLNKKLFRSKKTRIDFELTHYPPKVHDLFSPRTASRHLVAVVTRNLVDSIVSGYLYHKSGRECWLDPVGNDQGGKKRFPMQRLDWERVLSNPVVPWERTVPAKPVQGRSICEFLASESEQVGMEAYADFALGYWYYKMYNFYERVQQKQKQQQDPTRTPRVLFVCYEDLSNPVTRRETFHKMMEYFIPSGYHGHADPPIQSTDYFYQGGHATDPDENLRSRLRAIIKRLDKEVFDNWIAKADKALGCGGSQETKLT